jgi:hypothetical protein
MDTLQKILYAKLQHLECILKVIGSIEGFELGNTIIKFEFSKYHSGGSIDLFERRDRKIC